TLVLDFGRLALVLVVELAERDFLLLGHHVGGHVIGADMGRIHGRDMHGDALGQFRVATLEGGQHADGAAVDVTGDGAFAGHAGHAADLDVLADLGNQPLGGIGHAGVTVEAGIFQRFDVVDIAVQGDFGNLVGEG